MPAPTYNTVTITGQALYGNNSGEPVTVTLTPNFTVYFDSTNNITIAPQPISVNSAIDGTWSIANIIDPTPAGSGLSWKLIVQDKSSNVQLFSQVVQIAHANGASQGFLGLPSGVTNTNGSGSFPVPGGTAAAGQIPSSTGNGAASLWVYQNDDYFNPMNYGAAGNGTTDDSAAIQAACDALAANKGGVLYLPALQFLVTKTITYNGGGAANFAPIKILGSTKQPGGAPPGGTQILWAPGVAGYNVFDIGLNGVQGAYIDSVNFQPKTNPSGNNMGHVVVNASANLAELEMTNCTIRSSFSNYPTTAVKVNGQGSRFKSCVLSAYAQAIWMNGAQICDISNRTVMSTVAGSGFASLYMSNGASSVSITDAQTQGGDRGLWAVGTVPRQPGFISCANFAVNIPAIAGIQLDTGSQFWADTLWLSHSGGSTAAPVHGFVTGTGYQGFCTIANGTFQQWPGHGMWLQGGSGFNISSSSFGVCGQSAANTYDDVHIATGVSAVSLTGNHFDVDQFMGLGSPPPRSAIYLESGVSGIAATSNMWKATGYGTSPQAGPGTYALNTGNIGI